MVNEVPENGQKPFFQKRHETIKQANRIILKTTTA